MLDISNNILEEAHAYLPRRRTGMSRTTDSISSDLEDSEEEEPRDD